MIVEISFIITKNWKQYKHPSIGEYVKYFGYIRTLEYYSAINMNQYLTYVTPWVSHMHKRYILGFPGGPVVKNLPCNAGDTISILDPGRSHKSWGSEAQI